MTSRGSYSNWFGHCTTIAEVKAEYRRLCFMYHPDHGGDSEVMQRINDAYRLALHSGLASYAAARGSAGSHAPSRSSPAVPVRPQRSDPDREYSRDGLRQLWNGSAWQQVAHNQFQRTVGVHIVTLVQWTAGHETMWAVQADGEFSKFAFLTRTEAEEEGFNVLYRRLQRHGG